MVPKPVFSIICPVRNEAGNIPEIFKNTLPLGQTTELLFVEGNSTDTTWSKVSKLNNKTNSHGVFFRSLRQIGFGKSAAVETGFNQALGKYLVIMDADLTVSFRDLRQIINLFQKYGDNIIATGNRLKGISKPAGFYWLNYLGNYFFRYYFSTIFNTPILDFACGTKALTNSTWKKIKNLIALYGPLDSWGDLSWLYYGYTSGCAIKYTSVNYFLRQKGLSKLQNQSVRWRFAWEIFNVGLKIIRLNPKINAGRAAKV